MKERKKTVKKHNGRVMGFAYWELPKILGFRNIEIEDMAGFLEQRGLHVCGSEECRGRLQKDDAVCIARINTLDVKIVHDACSRRANVTHIAPRTIKLGEVLGLKDSEKVSISSC